MPSLERENFDIKLHSAGGAAELPLGFTETKEIDQRENMQTVQKKTPPKQSQMWVAGEKTV